MLITLILGFLVLYLFISATAGATKDATKGVNWLTAQLQRLDRWLAEKQAQQKQKTR